MHVSPLGKRVQSVGIVERGERRIYVPSPWSSPYSGTVPVLFCLLDEVDAPLDDANIGRFNEVVREIAQTSR